jgi:ABC-type branched-subunit amino acid transport system substrate-binding protein
MRWDRTLAPKLADRARLDPDRADQVPPIQEKQMQHRRFRWLAILAVAGVLVAACGEDREGEAGSSTTVAGEPGTETTAPAGEAVTFGDLPSPCGPGDASGATAQGVTDDAIVLGYGDDAGYAQAPGLDAEMGDAVEAMIDWCNEQGGINGRQIQGKYYDAKILEVNNVMLSACSEVFMLVGQGFSLDSAQEETRVGCGLGSVPGFSVSPEFAHGPDMMQPVPNPTDYAPVQIAAYMATTYPEQVKKAAVMFANYAATIDTKDKTLATYPAFGWEFLDCPQQYNIGGEDDWKPFVQKLKDCGAEVVYFTGSPNPNFQNFLAAAQQLEYSPMYVTDANFYTDTFSSWNSQNNGAGDNVYIRNAFVPLEEASTNKATQDYLDIIGASDGKISQLGAQSTDAFLLWATAAKGCGSTLTKECIFSEITKIPEWTGGGLHAKTNPSSNLPPDCGIVLKLEGGEFKRVFPEAAGEFDCGADFVQPVTGDVVTRAALNADRISTTYLR